MHPDRYQLAAYLDSPPDDPRRAELRGHLLTCARCAARVERLRADAAQLAALADAPAPDVRAAVRARASQPARALWLAPAGALAGVAATLLLVVALLASRGVATLGFAPDRLFLLDYQQGRLLEIDARDGAPRSAVAVGARPLDLRYDAARHQLYVLREQGVAALAPGAPAVERQWAAPEPFEAGAALALDEPAGLLYVVAPAQRAIFVVQVDTLTAVRRIDLPFSPGGTTLAPDGQTLYSLDTASAAIWSVDLASGAATGHLADRPDAATYGWLAVSADGARLFVLQWGGATTLSRIDLERWTVEQQAALPPGKAAWDLTLLADGQLAIPRGDGQTGGVEIVAPDTLEAVARLDPQNDQHHTLAAPDGALVAFTLGGGVTRYDVPSGATTWHVELAAQRVVGGAFVPSGWRLPF